MNHIPTLVLSCSLLALIGCAANVADETTNTSGGEEAVEEEALTSAANFGYFVVTRRDTRRCAAPLCGGYFVKRVNDAKTQCADGTMRAECYVDAIQLGGAALSPGEEADAMAKLVDGKAVMHARTYRRTVRGNKIGTLKANEVWLGATGSAPDGTFYRVADNGIRCITTPCPTTSAYELNGRDSHNVIEVILDQTTTPAEPDVLDRATSALGTAEGLVVSGSILLPKCIAGSHCGPKVIASEFFVKMTHREGEACGARTNATCNIGQFCQWTLGAICGAADAPGHCAYRPEVCKALYDPVCGCDGVTYSNACHAAGAGASVSSRGPCQ